MGILMKDKKILLRYKKHTALRNLTAIQFNLTITLGSYIYQEIDDADLGFGSPQILFTDGLLSSIDFFHDAFASGSFPDLQSGLNTITNGFFVDDFPNSVTLLEGTWDFVSAQTTPISSPGTWLLIISLIGLIRFFRSNQY